MSENTRIGREPLSVVTVSQDYCTRSHGTAPCTASGEPCFNTRATCQDPANYDVGVLPLNFVKSGGPQLTDGQYIPSLLSVEVSPAQINPGGAAKSVSALGRRASVTAVFQDHPHTDKGVDEYVSQRPYDPLTRSTMWAKWRARNPYYLNRALDFASGYFKDGQLVDGISRRFVLTDMVGPDASGRVRITAKDILTLLDGDKAQAPLVSTGTLSADISEAAGTATLSPAGVGDLEYLASGFVSRGGEVMEYTRAGDVLTFVQRGARGTTAGSHSAGDAVQMCLVYEAEKPADILYDILLNYAKIPAGYLDKTQWDAEQLGYLPRLYSTIITEPESVATLVAEMCEQMYFTVLYDERVSLVKIRAVRPFADETVTELNGDQHLVEDSVSWGDLNDQLITQVWVYYGRIDPTQKLDQISNYTTRENISVLENEAPEKYGTSRIKKIFSRWLDSSNAAAAVDLGSKVLALYANAPRECSFTLDAKDRDLWLADFVRIVHRNRVDQYGNPLPVNLQIRQAAEVQLGSRFAYVAQEFIPYQADEVLDPDVRNVIIAASMCNVNLRTLHDSQYGAPTGSEKITFIIREGVTIGGDSAGGGENVTYAARDGSNDTYDGGDSLITSTAVGALPIVQRAGLSAVRTTNAGGDYLGQGNLLWRLVEYPLSTAIVTGDWPVGVELSLQVRAGAAVLGEGGTGGTCGVSDSPGYSNTFMNPVQAGDGGHALAVSYPLAIQNAGVIGGGGGGGTGVTMDFNSAPVTGATGGGGAGFVPSRVKSKLITPPSTTLYTEANGGSTLLGGAGGKLAFSDYFAGSDLNTDGDGRGRGGDLGLPGASGSSDVRLGGVDVLPFAGVPGAAIIEGADLVTWIAKGDIRGAEIV